jgi:signal transduction histidine kinase
MRLVKRFAPLIVSIGLVIAVAFVGLLESANANGKAQQIRRDDRVGEETTLAGLTNQFIKFALKDAYDFASVSPLSLKPGDPADTALIRAFVNRSALLNYGGALADLTGKPLNAYVNGPGLPDATDPGFLPMQQTLLAGEPGVSSVMHVKDIPVVALAVPVADTKGTPRAVYVGFFRADRNPLQTYNERLHYGKTGRATLVDSTGTIVAATDPKQVGTKFASASVLQKAASGAPGFAEYTDHGVRTIAAYASDDIGGWASINTQTAAEFFGPIRSGGLHVALALAALLVVAAAGLFVLNHKRQMALAKAYEYKGQLLANTTHELKTPLTAIRGAAVTLGMRWRTMKPEQIDQFLGIIHRRCDGLSKLIERILLGARLEAGREIATNPVPTELTGALRAITSEFEDVSPKHPIALNGADGTWVNVDPDALDQVFGLLLENAIKYSPDGGEVAVRARSHNGSVVVDVSDHGVGISPADLQHIFDPYYRASRSDSGRYSGVGLGLSIVKHLVQRSGGDVTVDSTPGQGTTFTVTLPKCEPPKQVAAVELMGADR